MSDVTREILTEVINRRRHDPAFREILRRIAEEGEDLLDKLSYTAAETADLLGLSRAFVAGLLDDGTIPSQILERGDRRGVLLSDVIAFQERRARMGEGRRRISEIVEADSLGEE